MPRTPRPEDVPYVSCAVCRKEVPRSEARSAEAQDYVLYFCGPVCYDTWRLEAQSGRVRRP